MHDGSYRRDRAGWFKVCGQAVSNTKQLDAFRYGSAFSRGALIRESDVTILQVSEHRCD